MTPDTDPVVIHEYDITWPERFNALAARARSALEGIVVQIEHVGSTAVPGLAAKPVIDLDVAVRRGQVPRAIALLETIGYVHDGDHGIEGREAFRWPAGEPRHHLYVMEEGATELRRHIAFRDALRSDPGLRDTYAALKRDLATRYRDHRAAYTTGKGALIAMVLARCGATDTKGDPDFT
jgi:GrpB-like predicted nucleotidyltransferase (UPF0157 family)